VEADAQDVLGTASFEECGLPDARQRTVPALLAEWDLGQRCFRILVRVVARALDAQLDLVRTSTKMLGDVEEEGQEPTLMRTDQRIVNEHSRVVEYGAEVNEDALGTFEPALHDIYRSTIDPRSAPRPEVAELRLPR
jgi:hypothetical protein